MDTSNLQSDYRCFTTLRKRISGLFKDEANERTIFEFVELCTKSYAFDEEHKVSIRAKGVMRHVIKNHLTLDDHKRCLFASDTDDDIEDGQFDIELGVHASKLLVRDSARQVVERIHLDASSLAPPPQTPSSEQRAYEMYTPYRENVSIRSFKHQVYTVKTMKLSLNRTDDKRHILPDHVHTLTHGHYKIVLIFLKCK